ncbi:MAG: YARHG domain-containing protein [Candidatus Ornithomonoglobus sp.]
MKCSICGSELEYGSNVCKYCGNVEAVSEPEIIPEDLPETEDVDFTRTYDIHRTQDSDSKPEGTGTILPEIPDRPPVYTPPVREEHEIAEPVQESDAQNIPARSENDMGNKTTNSRRKKKKHPVRIAVIMVLAMMVIFAVTFSIFFHLLGGSFSEEEPTDTPAPVETLPVVATERSISTEAPAEKATTAPKKATEKPTEAPKETEAPEPAATEDTRTSDYLFNSSRNVIRQSELEARTREEIKYIYYEIYARHGYDFQDAELKEYFLGKTWYEPVTSHRESAESQFNVVERENIEIIEEYQREQGWRQ